jgi:hypothetical protein
MSYAQEADVCIVKATFNPSSELFLAYKPFKGTLRLATAYYQKTTVATSAYYYISFAGFLLTPPGGQSQTFGKTTQL